ncbi:MAG: hypothetical protein JWO42_2900, partial [Chloroflexi bacterium]|nr:hypothetical protein [Chloroflexota bacterium]
MKQKIRSVFWSRAAASAVVICLAATSGEMQQVVASPAQDTSALIVNVAQAPA